MTVDPTPVIVAITVLMGGSYATFLNRRGTRESAARDREAAALEERVQRNKELNEDVENERRWRREERIEHEAELAQERALTEHQRVVAQHERDRGTVLGQQLQSATETILILKRAVRDEALKVAADIAIQALVQDADQTLNDADQNNL